jgi:hypothetical protein
MIIEQSKEQVEDSVSFHKQSEIGFLRLAHARVWSRDQITKFSPEDIVFDISFKPGTSTSEDGAIFLQTEFIFAMNEIPAGSAEEPKQPLIAVECCFEAEYRFAEGFTPTDKQIEAFRSANAVFNCWPFFREFVQTSVTRMHFPPPPIPFLRLTRKKDARRSAQKHIPRSTSEGVDKGKATS